MIERDKLEYRPGVVGYIFDRKGNLLLCQNKGYEQNEWRMPGGGINDGESPIDALVREIKEEFSMTIEVRGQLNGICQFEWPDDLVIRNIAKGNNYRGQRQYQVAALAVNPDMIIIDTNEIQNYVWINPNDIDPYLVFPNQRETTRKALLEIKNNQWQ